MDPTMPCSITDGPQESGDEQFTPYDDGDPDEYYDRIKQQELDDKYQEQRNARD